MVKRILHIFGQMYRGGAESRTMDLYHFIDRDKVQFDFVVMKKGEHYFFDEIRKMGGRIFYIDPPKEVGYLNHIKQLEFIIKNDGPFYGIHAHTAFNEGIAITVAKRMGIKVRIAHSRSASDLHPKGLKTRVYTKLMRILINKNSTDLIMCSTEAGNYLFGKRAVNSGRVHFLPNAIDVNNFGNIKWRNEVREELRIPSDCTVIGTVGNLREVKNQLFLIDIFSKFIKIHKNSYLVIVGDGPLKQKIIDKIKLLNLEEYIFLLGARNDVPRILMSFDIFTLPSLYEGLPGAVVEAQASGLSCLISDSITREVDICDHIVEYLPLAEGADIWSKKIESILMKKKPSIELCKSKVSDAGYNVKDSASILTSIYKLNI